MSMMLQCYSVHVAPMPPQLKAVCWVAGLLWLFTRDAVGWAPRGCQVQSIAQPSGAELAYFGTGHCHWWGGNLCLAIANLLF